MLKNYFKIAFRNLTRNKTYGFLNIMGLALSIACGILLFTLVKYHLSFDDFHKDSDRIYRVVTEQHRDQISYVNSVPPPLGKALRNDYVFGETVARSAVFDNETITLDAGAEMKKFKEKNGVAFAEPGYFDIFNFPLLQGDKKTVLSEPYTAIITESLARKYFGNDNPLGKVFRLDSKIDCKVTGILKNLPDNTDQKTEIFISWPTLTAYNKWMAADDSWGGIIDGLQCFVRLRPNISPAQVEKLLPAYVTKYRPKSKNVHHYKLQPLREMHFDGRYGGVMEKRNLWILSFIGLFLIITACVNFINLATAQALRRSREVGIRKVLGSLRWQLFWQFIAETGLIAVAATGLAICLSFFMLPYVNQWFNTRIPFHAFGDWQLLCFIPLLIVLVTFLAGSYPGLILSGFRPVMALKGKLSMQSIGGFNTRRTLIVGQFTISLVLIIGMIVITRQMQYAKQSDLGFNKDAVVMMPMGGAAKEMATKTLKDRLANIPGVEKVSLCFSAPSSDETWNTSIRFDTRQEDELFRVNMKSGDDQYLPTFGLQLLTGRNIFPSDSVREFLVNETLVHKLGLQSPGDAIGRKIAFNGGNSSGVIVGVLKDFHDRSFHEDINALCVTTSRSQYTDYAVKINMKNLASVMPALEKTWSATHPDQVYEYQFLDDQIAAFYEMEETMLKLIRSFAVIAIFIGCLGLYGLVAFMVAQKTKEIGIRKVLGSGATEILWIFGKEFARLIGIAFLVAAPISWLLMNHWLQNYKYHIPLGPWIFVLAALLVMGVAAVTVGYQSIRAAWMNPVKSLRTE